MSEISITCRHSFMNIVEFEQKLAKQNLNYEALTPLNHGYVHIRFGGRFQNQDTIWDAHLYSLAYYINNVAGAACAEQARQFIHVGSQCDGLRELSIGLNVPVIDEPTIQKSIIMIRQYKNLRSGQHEYGPSVKM